MGRKAQAALLPLGCAFILVGVLNHVKLHLNVDHFGIIMGVLAVLCMIAGGWASVQELRGAPARSSAAPAAAPVAFGMPADAPVPEPVGAGQDDATIQA